tara:strand:- start:1 stop:213 length:213 start_codon:yes stop_codon:yes gene_type:complete
MLTTELSAHPERVQMVRKLRQNIQLKAKFNQKKAQTSFNFILSKNACNPFNVTLMCDHFQRMKVDLLAAF